MVGLGFGVFVAGKYNGYMEHAKVRDNVRPIRVHPLPSLPVCTITTAEVPSPNGGERLDGRAYSNIALFTLQATQLKAPHLPRTRSTACVMM